MVAGLGGLGQVANKGQVMMASWKKEGIKGTRKRHNKSLRDNTKGISNPSIRRLARKGGVKRIAELCYDEAHRALRAFLFKVIKDTVTYTDYARRKTVITMDIVLGLKSNGVTYYGPI